MRSTTDNQPIRATFSSILRLYKETREHLRWGGYRFAGGALKAVLATALSYLAGSMVAVALSGSTDVLLRYAIAFLGAAVALAAIDYINTYTGGRYSILSGRTLKKRAFAKIHELPIAYYESDHSGATISRITTDIESLSSFYDRSMGSLYSFYPLVMALSFAVLVSVNLPLAAICATTVPLFTYLIGKVNLPVGQLARDRQAAIAELNSRLRDIVEGIGIYKAFGMYRSHGRRVETVCRRATDLSVAVSRKHAATMGVSIFGRIFSQVIVIAIGTLFVVRGAITVAELMVFFTVLWSFLGGFELVLRSWGEIVEQSGRARHLFELFDAEPERTDGESEVPPIGGPRSDRAAPVAFDDVFYRYGEAALLQNVSFHVPAGATVAMVGASGSGKTTIHKLLRGFYDSYEGEIRVLGRELRDWNLQALRSQLAVVTQEVYLFNESVIENIRFARPAASDEEVVAAATRAYAHQFIVDLSDGYQTVLGERGARLSGGQRQRLAIARAMLSTAPIILLDEPTSALDTQSEAHVQAALDRLEEERTVFVIAHRLSTIRNADQIIVLDGGRIVEQGTHEELIGLDNRYHDLYQKQEAL